MASFEEHLAKAQSNLQFLENVCKNEKHFWDWKVTICFYVAVHLVNAHIAKKSGLHYRSHEDVLNAINPNEVLSLARMDETNYLSYAKLRNLSRRSRYLVSDDIAVKDINAYFTHDRHFAKAIRHLDKIISFVNEEYSENLDKIKVVCVELKQGELSNFLI